VQASLKRHLPEAWRPFADRARGEGRPVPRVLTLPRRRHQTPVTGRFLRTSRTPSVASDRADRSGRHGGSR
jgi:hypothetical protein